MLEETDTLLQPLLDEDVLDVDPVPHIPSNQPRRRRRRRRWLTVAIIVLVIGLIAGGGGLYWWLNRPSPIRYLQAAVTTGNINITVAGTGPVTPNAQYNLNFPIAGQISAINVKIGQQVSQGQILA